MTNKNNWQELSMDEAYGVNGGSGTLWEELKKLAKELWKILNLPIGRPIAHP